MNQNIINYPTIPTEIVVHLGSPTEAAKVLVSHLLII